MVDLTRRGFLRTASISAATIGVLGALPSLARADEQGVGPSTPAPGIGGSVPMTNPIDGGPALAAPLVVYIDNPSSGKGVIFVGEQEVPFDNPTLVQSLQSAMA